MPPSLSAERLPLFRRLALLLASSCLWVADAKTSAQQLPPLTSAREIAQHREADPENPTPARLEGVVTFVDASTIYIQDQSGATFLHYPNRSEALEPGQRVLVDGFYHNGLFVGGVRPTTVQIQGSGPLPPPRRITNLELASGRWHYHWVEVEGVVRAFQSTGESSGVLTISGANGLMELRLDETPENPASLVDATIRATGIASGVINSQRQLVFPYVRLKNSSSLTIVEPAPPDAFAIEATPIALLQGDVVHRIKVSGQALSAPLSSTVFIRDSSSTIMVRTTKPPKIKAGDIVEAVGFVEAGPVSARLTNAVCRIVAEGPLPQPHAATGASVQSGNDGNLLRFDTTILQRIDVGTHTQLLVQHGPVAITILSRKTLEPHIMAGSRVSALGVLRITKISSRGHRSVATAADLLLRDDTELILLSKPPLLNSRDLTIILLVVGTLALLAAAWATLLRRQVARQTRIIQKQIEGEAVTEERHRIAREFHDTLEQELAGIALRLDAAAERVADDKARNLLGQLRKLLLRLQNETRAFIWNLRESPPSGTDLPTALRMMLENLQSNTTVPLRLDHKAKKPPIEVSPMVQHQLLTIAREAVHNAIKYAANAHQIDVHLTHENDTLLLTIADDGTGFAPDEVSAGHFGLQGMSERAHRIQAKLEIISNPGQGTRIKVRVPLEHP